MKLLKQANDDGCGVAQHDAGTAELDMATTQCNRIAWRLECRPVLRASLQEYQCQYRDLQTRNNLVRFRSKTLSMHETSFVACRAIELSLDPPRPGPYD